MTISLSVIILTYNEEANIGRCLDSVAWCDDIVVLDSHSTDSTSDIAVSKGARVMLRRFDNYANQRNFALQEIDYKHAWALMLDADETVPDSLRQELQTVMAKNDTDVTLCRMRRKDYFMGTWLKYSTNYKSLWFGRLVRLGRVWVERTVNEEYHTDGHIRNLNSALTHYPFNKGLSEWIDKHNRYSSMEAKLIFTGDGQSMRWAQLLTGDPVVRRKALKSKVYSMPGRPLLMFFGRYIVSRGFLDGWPGLRFCLLKSYYEYLIDCKVAELKLRKKNLPI